MKKKQKQPKRPEACKMCEYNHPCGHRTWCIICYGSETAVKYKDQFIKCENLKLCNTIKKDDPLKQCSITFYLLYIPIHFMQQFFRLSFLWSLKARISRRYRADGGYADILKLSIPLILSSGSWAMMHFIDRIFLTWDGSASLAASGPAGILNYTLMCTFIGTASYVSAFTAQYAGAGKSKETGLILWQSIYFSLFSGVLLTVFCFFSAESIFAFVGHAPDVRARELIFFLYLSPGITASILIGALSGFLSGIEKTWPVLLANIFVNGSNIILDYILIFGNFGAPALGIKGAAIATTFSAWVGVIILLGFVFTAKHENLYGVKSQRRFSINLMGDLVKFGFPSGFAMFLDIVGFTVFFFIMGREGLVPLAATNIAFNVNSLAFMPMVGMGSAITVLVGQFVGAKKFAFAERTVYSACHLAFTYLLIVALAYWFLPGIFIKPFSSHSDPESFKAVASLTTVLLKFVAFYSLFDALNIAFSSALRGAGDTRFVTLMIAILSIGALIIPAWILLGVMNVQPIWGWVVVTAYCCLLGISFFIRFKKGPWRTFTLVRN